MGIDKLHGRLRNLLFAATLLCTACHPAQPPTSVRQTSDAEAEADTEEPADVDTSADAVDNENAAPPANSEPTFDDPPDDDLLEDTPNAEYLGTLTLEHVTVAERVFLVWVADEPAERIRGLMFVTDEEIAALPDGRERGMLFIWPTDNTSGFWMRDTIIPLDVAFIREDGSIDTIHTMTPLDESIYPPQGPYRYALEVSAGTFDDLDVGPEDVVELP